MLPTLSLGVLFFLFKFIVRSSPTTNIQTHITSLGVSVYDLKVLINLLTGHIALNGHFTIMKVHTGTLFSTRGEL